MKEQAIKRINKMGKVGVIILTIIKAFLIIGIVATLIGTITCALLPKDLMTMKFSGDATVTINMEAAEKMTGKVIDEKDLKGELIKSGDLSVDGKEYAMNEMSLDGKNLVIDADAESPRMIGLGNLTFVCACGLVLLATSLMTMIFAGSLCKAFRDCQSPFEENVIKRMQYLAYSLIPWVALNSIALGVISYAIGRTDGIALDLNISTVLVVLVVFALVYVFKYGALLQQESDETL